MHRSANRLICCLFIAGLVMLAGCTRVVEQNNQLATIAKPIIADTKKSWRNLLTYSPKNTTPQLPQTRYCYTTMADIVCYDSAQPTTTSRLYGYQDGENISWVQPGGGSLGVSGGEPMAQASSDQAHIAPNARLNSASSEISVTDVAPISSAAMTPTAPPPPAAVTVGSTKNPGEPFYRKQSPYMKAP